jgi:hypothetical protein
MNGTATGKFNLFIISGNKMLEKVSTFLVTNISENSNFGKILRSLQVESENTLLQIKLSGLADWIRGLGSA